MNNPRPCDISGIIKPNLCREALLDIETIKSVSGTIPLTNYYNKEYSILSWAEQLGTSTNKQTTPAVQYAVQYAAQYAAQYAVQYAVQYTGLVFLCFETRGGALMGGVPFMALSRLHSSHSM